MKFQHNDIRTIHFSEIPDDKVQEMDVRICYPGDGDLRQGIALDRIVIPQILKGLRLVEIFEGMDTLEVEEMVSQMKKFSGHLK